MRVAINRSFQRSFHRSPWTVHCVVSHSLAHCRWLQLSPNWNSNKKERKKEREEKRINPASFTLIHTTGRAVIIQVNYAHQHLLITRYWRRYSCPSDCCCCYCCCWICSVLRCSDPCGSTRSRCRSWPNGLVTTLPYQDHSTSAPPMATNGNCAGLLSTRYIVLYLIDSQASPSPCLWLFIFFNISNSLLVFRFIISLFISVFFFYIISFFIMDKVLLIKLLIKSYIVWNIASFSFYYFIINFCFF